MMIRRQRGAALAYVLGLLTVFGILTSLVIRYTRFNDALVSRNRWDSQARLTALSGVDYALSRIDPPGPGLDLDFSSEGVEYRLENPNLRFHVKVASRGLYARVESHGNTNLPGMGREKHRVALVGQAMDLGAMPAVGLLEKDVDFKLAGTAEVTGPILLWRGAVRKATDFHMRWKGEIGHTGPVWDSSSAAWALTTPVFTRAENWIRAQEAMVEGGDTRDDPDYDSGMVRDVDLGDLGILADTVLEGVRVRAGKVLKVGSGAILLDCKLLAPSIVVEGDAVLENVMAFASRNLKLKGGSVTGGQFAALDSLEINLDHAMEGWPIFYVHGRKVNRGKPDSAYLGVLRVEKATGEGLFLSAVVEKPVNDQNIRLYLGKDLSLSGLFYCGGYAHVEGRLQGSLICQNLKFEYQGIIWPGHLKNAHIRGFSGSKVVPAPLLFPGLPILSHGAGLP